MEALQIGEIESHHSRDGQAGALAQVCGAGLAKDPSAAIDFDGAGEDDQIVDFPVTGQVRGRDIGRDDFTPAVGCFKESGLDFVRYLVGFYDDIESRGLQVEFQAPLVQYALIATGDVLDAQAPHAARPVGQLVVQGRLGNEFPDQLLAPAELSSRIVVEQRSDVVSVATASVGEGDLGAVRRLQNQAQIAGVGVGDVDEHVQVADAQALRIDANGGNGFFEVDDLAIGFGDENFPHSESIAGSVLVV